MSFRDIDIAAGRFVDFDAGRRISNFQPRKTAQDGTSKQVSILNEFNNPEIFRRDVPIRRESAPVYMEES